MLSKEVLMYIAVIVILMGMGGVSFYQPMKEGLVDGPKMNLFMEKNQKLAENTGYYVNSDGSDDEYPDYCITDTPDGAFECFKEYGILKEGTKEYKTLTPDNKKNKYSIHYCPAEDGEESMVCTLSRTQDPKYKGLDGKVAKEGERYNCILSSGDVNQEELSKNCNQ